MRIPRASEFFISGIEGLELNKKEQAFLKENPLGGIILFKRNIQSIEQVVALNASIIKTARNFPPLISVDQEGGRVARLRGICTDLPPMTKLAEVLRKDPRLLYRIGAMQGRELAVLGFNLNFSPVCDVINNSANQVIGDRAFSSCQEIVARFASHYIKGLQGAGIAACAKHFPGHGATAVDSHFALPILDTDFDTVSSRELVPFRAAIQAEVATIMTAHIVTNSIDSLPATMSEEILTNLLRHSLGFNNVIISDDLDMKAVRDHYSLVEILKKGLLASIDLFIVGSALTKTLDSIEVLQRLLDTEDIVRSKAIEATYRIDKLRKRYIGESKAPDVVSAQAIVRSHPHLELVRSYS
jgi:beta-N-acetylhexosaminidase